ncbi:hypothetical protein CVT25_004937 [Psilocybe cyanescens]|uniref:21S rRNA pseudouridine(2819) synthase n=1 Tax=Psilocybe cyanescens TaxID=93625 RepID=A0A409XU75_PSICY|nr:hypothetical protein CVT25_004937 [Psilocybe cyanescens]
MRDVKRWIPSSDPCSVHRLDKPTTGCLLVALNSANGKSLSRQFQQGTVNKTYLALVRGGEKSFDSKSGRIDIPILYNDGRGEISTEGKSSVTEWELLGSSTKAPLSLLRLHLITGNKHQLRIHLAKSLNTPILGDFIYSLKPLNPTVTDATEIPKGRLFLHASEVSFYKYTDRGKRYRLGIRSPVPLDFQFICRDVGIDLPHVDGAMMIDGNMPQDDDLDRRLWDSRQSYD